MEVFSPLELNAVGFLNIDTKSRTGALPSEKGEHIRVIDK